MRVLPAHGAAPSSTVRAARSVRSGSDSFRALRGPHFGAHVIQRVRQIAGNTFAVALSNSLGVDVAREGINAVMHRPLGVHVPGLGLDFTLTDPRGMDLAPLRRAKRRRYQSGDGVLELRHDPSLNAFVITARSADREALRGGHDRLGVILSYDAGLRLSEIHVRTNPCRRSLSRTYLSLLLKSTGFSDSFPRVCAMLTEQLVLETPSDVVRRREKIAYGEIDLDALDGALKSGESSKAIEHISDLQHSKSLELRRFGAVLLSTMYQQKRVSEDAYFELRERLFLEDVREDLIFIERTLRRQPSFLQATFSNIFGEQYGADQLNGARFDVQYFARGYNKQIYVVHAELLNRAVRTFAISTLRDGQFSQSDFDQERINEAYSHWREISGRGCPDIVRFGAEHWHYEWRSRRIKMHNGHMPVTRILNNDLVLVARQFFDDATPVNVLYHQARSHAEKRQLCFDMAKAYWRFWLSTGGSAPQGAGVFVTTPRAEDIVRNRAGRFMIVDPDTIVAQCSEEQARSYFLAYPYYNQKMIREAKTIAVREHAQGF